MIVNKEILVHASKIDNQTIIADLEETDYPDWKAVIPVGLKPDPTINEIKIDLDLLADFSGEKMPVMRFNSVTSAITLYGNTDNGYTFVGLIMSLKHDPYGESLRLSNLLSTMGILDPIEAVKKSS